ncbi:MAG: GNAT family N-acetyltransferase [Suipraeoptans sp.]
MSIRILDQEEYYKAREVYESVFPEDSKGFVDYYFTEVTKNNIIYVLEDGDKVCSMIHLNPYRAMINDTETLIHYIVAVATLKEERSKGYMGQLLNRVLNDMYDAGEVFTYLMPVAEAIYTPYDFRTVFRKQWEYCNVSDLSYREFGESDADAYVNYINGFLDNNYMIYTLRDYEYYSRLIKEYKSDGATLMTKEDGERVIKVLPKVLEPSLTNTPYMVRIINVEKLVGMLPSKIVDGINLEVEDKIICENNSTSEKRIPISEFTDILFKNIKVRFDEVV